MMAVAEALRTASPTTIFRQRKRLSRLSNNRRKPFYQAVLATPSTRRTAITAAWDCIKDGKNIEPCCGTGRVLVPLAKAGHNATGMDADEGMLARLPAKSEGLTNLKYSLANILTTDWGFDYDVVVMPTNTLMNIEHRDDDNGFTTCLTTRFRVAGN